MNATADTTALVRRHLPYGYFADGRNGAYIFCPTCREQLDAPWSPLEKRGLLKQLTDVLTVHLSEDCAPAT